MHEQLRSVAAFILVVSLMAVAGAQEPSAAQQVVARFAEALSAGRIVATVELLSGGVTWSEHDLYWRTVTGADARFRAYELIRAGVRLETELVAVVGDGQIVIAHERMWGDFVPEGMAPLRSTTIYVVESNWLAGITRVLSAEQRDALTRSAVADSTWGDGFGNIHHRFDADGTYRNFDTLEDMRSDHHAFSGTYEVERGVFTWVADADTRVCNPGERFVMRGRMIDRDRWEGVLLPEQTNCNIYRERLMGQPYATVRVADE